MRVFRRVVLLAAAPGFLWASLPEAIQSPDSYLAEDLTWIILADDFIGQVIKNVVDEDNPILVRYNDEPIETKGKRRERAAAVYDPESDLILIHPHFRLIADQKIRRLLLWRTLRHEMWHLFSHELGIGGFAEAEELAGEAAIEEPLRRHWAQGLLCLEGGWDLRETAILRDLHYDACQDALGDFQGGEALSLSPKQIATIDRAVSPYRFNERALEELERDAPLEAAKIYYLLGLERLTQDRSPQDNFIRAVSVNR
ncbi:MAG: hypothetical protein HY547_00240 [Elusimicrobia bacterium]|nr:hypothetical protein [Elusimicrobiota bacterium]